LRRSLAEGTGAATGRAEAGRPSRLTASFPKLLPILGGVVSGALVSLFVSTRMHGTAPPPRPELVERDGRAAVPSWRGLPDVAVDPRVGDLSSRVAALEKRGLAGSATEEAPPPIPDVEASRTRAQEAHRAAIERHQSESADPGWARHAVSAVGDTLTKLGQEKGFTFGKVDCRSTSCTASIGWPNRGDASRTYADLLHASYGDVNCRREILIPDDADPALPVEATFVLSGCRAAPQ
jgi:hypothetical protein